MTYIDLVNNVLRRLRENEVSTITLTDYSKLAGDYVNDAKDQVESAWDWSQLRTVVTVPTIATEGQYTISGFSDKSKILGVVNDTANRVMEYRPRAWLEEKLYTGNPENGTPAYYTFSGVDGVTGDANITVFPTPNDVYSLRFDTTQRGVQLTNDLDTMAIPHMPVIHLAVALLARERGENGGTTTAEYFQIADRYLADAISYDAARHPEETVWFS